VRFFPDGAAAVRRKAGFDNDGEEKAVETSDKDWLPHTVLVGYDGSEGANDAIRLVGMLAGATDAEALLVNVLPYPGPLPVAYRLLGYDEAPSWKTFFTGAERELSPLHVAHRTYAGGSPAKVLNDIAEEEDVDLIVIGSPHRGTVGRAFVGSVAEGLLHGASVAVVAAPRRYRERVHDGFTRIVVGFDGSAEAGIALRRGAAIATREDVELHVACASAPPVVTPGPFAGPVPSTLPNARAVVVRGVRSVGPDVDARGTVLEGGAARQLAGYCGPDDLLMVGSRSYGPLTRTLLGSVSSKLIHTAPCPVLVVPRPHHVAKQPAEQTEPAVAEAA
jgi:nucleotide-binding universal stress UspA family protein